MADIDQGSVSVSCSRCLPVVASRFPALLSMGAPMVALLVVLLVGCAKGPPSPGGPGADLVQGDLFRVVLLHDNDHHFHRNHPLEVEAWVEKVRQAEDRVYLVNAGDVLVRHRDRWPDGADDTWYLEWGRELVNWMNHLRYDAMTPGNHDLFAIGEHTREVLDEAAFPILSANIQVETPYLPQPQPYVTLSRGPGEPRIALLGLSVVNAQEGIDLQQRDPIEVVEEYLHLSDTHEALVLLTHLGHARDLELARAHPQVTAILGGHSHTLVPEAIRENGVLVAQAGGHPHARRPDAPMWMGTVVLEFRNGRLVGSCGWVVEIDGDGVRLAGQEGRDGGTVTAEDVVRCPMAA